MKTLRERFWAKVSVGEPDECWDWSGSKTAFGYGVISVDGKLARAHRVSVELDGRMIPHGMVVMHTCDNQVAATRLIFGLVPRLKMPWT